jgi:hypothetical protein
MEGQKEGSNFLHIPPGAQIQKELHVHVPVLPSISTLPPSKAFSPSDCSARNLAQGDNDRHKGCSSHCVDYDGGLETASASSLPKVMDG